MWLQLTLAAFAVALLTVIVYGNTVDNGFVWDDHEQIVMNPYVKSGAPLTPLFTGDARFAHQGPSVQTKAYRPLQMLTYRLVTEGLGDSATALHVVSINFAAAGAVAALMMFWLLTGRIGVALAAASLFAVHPVHTEAVDWIAALPDLGVGLMLMTTFIFFLAAQRPAARRGGRWIWHTLSVVAFLTAMLWKETAVVLPLLILAYSLLHRDGGPQAVGPRVVRALKQSSPFWLCLAAYLWLRYEALGPLTAGARDWALTSAQYTLTALQLFLAYWGKMLLPISLNAYTVLHPLRSAMSVAALVTMLGTILVLAGVVYLVRRAPLAGFAAIWVCVLLLPGLNLSALGRNAFAERYLYAASAGFCLLVVLAALWLVEQLPARYHRAIGAMALVIVLGLFSEQTVARAATWKDDATLFGETLTASPDAPFLHIMVASTQSEDATQLSAAEENYRQAIALAKAETSHDRLDIVAGDEGLASLYAGRGEVDRALQVLDDAKQIAGETYDIASEEGILLSQAGRGAEAEPLLRRAQAVQPDNENILSGLGLVARDVHHDLPAAAAYFQQALAAHPQLDDFNAAQHSNLAGVYLDEDNVTAALAEARQAVTIAPRDPEYHDTLATVLAASGRFAEARTEAQTALQLAPNDPNAKEILRRLAQH
jgi:Flp pilus assembly protein TadD